MSFDIVLDVAKVNKTFRIFRRPSDRIRQLFSRQQLYRSLHAVKDATFSLPKGKFMGVIGENGSGKSTLLKLVAGVLVPDSGLIRSQGKIAGLLELGTGFNVEQSGRKNIFLNGVYLGLRHNEIAECEDSIIDFSELGDFIDTPLKNYSSGMAMRLAFAIAIHAQPACFIIDEALSVGDVRFQQKCFIRLDEFRNRGGSVLFVSHDLNAVKLVCDTVMVMEHGSTLYLGDPEEAVNLYNELLSGKGNSGQNTKTGYGNGAVQFKTVEILNAAGEETDVFTSGQPLRIHFTWECREPVGAVTFGFLIRDRFGQDVFGTNGAHLRKLVNVTKDGEGWFDIEAINVSWGVYSVNMAAHSGGTHLDDCYHWWDNAAGFEVVHDDAYYFEGHTRLKASLRVE